jgi:hypothetical protein
MWVRPRTGKYKIELAQDILHKRRCYKKNVDDIIVDKNNEYFEYNETGEITHFKIEDEKIEINNWLTFFGIWLAEGCIHKQNNYVVLSAHKQRVKDELILIADFFGWNFNKQRDHHNAEERNIWNL